MRLTSEQLAELTSKPGYSVAASDSHTTPAPLVECGVGHGPLAKSEAQGGNPARVLVRVVSFRRRLLDEDNLCEKFAVDCARYAGILAGDSAAEAKIETSQQKVSRKEDERTEVEIDVLP